ncbi:nitronate monooxygenase [Alcaligenes nematophilus]
MSEANRDFAGNVITDMCGVQYPIFLAGMAAISGPQLVAAVANAGGMGVLGGLRLAPLMLRKWLRETRALTDQPFGVNVVPQFGGPEVFEAQFQVILQERPRILSLFYAEDYSADMIPRAKDAGMIVMVQTGTVALARKAIAHGADIIVAQGGEAGGHLNRGTIGLMSLLPAILDCAQGTSRTGGRRDYDPPGCQGGHEPGGFRRIGGHGLSGQRGVQRASALQAKDSGSQHG